MSRVRLFQALALVLTSGCAYLPAKPDRASEAALVVKADAAEVRGAAIEALAKLGFEVERADAGYVQAYRPRWQTGWFTGGGGETVGVWVDAGDGGTTKVSVDTARTYLGYLGQRRWEREILAAIDTRLGERARTPPQDDLEALVRGEPSARIHFGVFDVVDRGFTQIGWSYAVDGTRSSVSLNDSAGFLLEVALPNRSDGLLETELAAGWKGKRGSWSNGTLEWNAFPLEALECLNVGPIRLSMGPTVYVAPKLTATGALVPLDRSFGYGLGLIGQGTVVIPFERRRGGVATSLNLGARYTLLKLPSGSTWLDASTVGFVLEWMW